jgi:hypothetical protein
VPRCGQFPERVHNAYERRLADARIGGQPVTIRLAVRPFRHGGENYGCQCFLIGSVHGQSSCPGPVQLRNYPVTESRDYDKHAYCVNPTKGREPGQS